MSAVEPSKDVQTMLRKLGAAAQCDADLAAEV